MPSIDVHLVDRAGWGARPPKRVNPLDPDPSRPGYEPAPEVFIHHTAAGVSPEVAQVRGVQNYHMDSPDRLYNDIAYNLLFGQSGTIYEGRGWDVQSGGTGNPYDRYSYSLCAIGNFSEVVPSDALVESMARMIAIGIVFGKIVRNPVIRGNRDVAPTACPGDHLYARLPQIRTRVRELMREQDEAAALPPEPQEAPPMLIGAHDAVVAGPGTLTVTGWAGSTSGAPVAVVVSVDGHGERAARVPRADVAAAHPALAAPAGYEQVVDVTGGVHRLKVDVVASADTLTLFDADVDVPPVPVMIEEPGEALADALARAAAAIAEAQRLAGR